METFKKVFRIIGFNLAQTFKKGQIQNNPRLDPIHYEYYLKMLQEENAILKDKTESWKKKFKDSEKVSKKKTVIITILLAALLTILLHTYIVDKTIATLLGTLSSLFTVLGTSITKLFK